MEGTTVIRRGALVTRDETSISHWCPGQESNSNPVVSAAKNATNELGLRPSNHLREKIKQLCSMEAKKMVNV